MLVCYIGYVWPPCLFIFVYHCSDLPDGYTIDNIQPKDIPMMNAAWPYNQGKTSEEYLLFNITHCRNACIYSPSGEPVAWNTLCWDSMAGFAHVQPSVRRLGLAKQMTWDIANKAVQMNMQPFAFMVNTNVR